jgi:hypothetical protein
LYYRLAGTVFLLSDAGVNAERKTKTKSPIKNLPVRLPGQSLQNRIMGDVFERFMGYGVAAIIAVVLAALEWQRFLFHSRPHPWPLTVLAVIVVIVALVKCRAALREVRDLKLGRIGEEAVGQYLEEKLRPLGCQVLHDIPGDGFNIDHVLIGPTGIYCIETKTISKPEKGGAEVKFDGEKITVNGFAPDRDPIVQVKAGAHFLRDLLAESAGKKFEIRPVVLYPGWFVSKQPANADVWVLNEKALPTFIQNARSSLPPEDINLVTFHLKRYVIAKTKEERA